MSADKTHAERTAAADKAIGFEYQYYYFLWRVFKLGVKETVGLEVLDDVHIKLDNDYQILFQLKHTTQRQSNGAPANLTTLDRDLWKTLSNWSRMITDPVAGRSTERSRREFINKTEFWLVSNKSRTDDCGFFAIHDAPESALQGLVSLASTTIDSGIKSYINSVIDLGDALLSPFIRKVQFQLEVNDIIQRCKDAIREKHIPEERIDELFGVLDSQIRQDNFVAIRVGEKMVVSFSDFTQKYRRYFDVARSRSLVISRSYTSLPCALEQQTFIRQLVDIQDIAPGNYDAMALRTISVTVVRNNLAKWVHAGDLTAQEVSDFAREATARWENKFRASYRKKPPVDSEHEVAQSLLDSILSERLSMGDQLMDTDFSNGEFYRLSDVPEIGWPGDWEHRYK